MIRHITMRIVFFVSLLVAFSVFGQEKKNLRIVFVSLSWNNQLPIRVAINKGFFREQGLTLEPIFVRGGPTAIAALVSGNVDFDSIGGAQAPIRSRARGLDLPVVKVPGWYDVDDAVSLQMLADELSGRRPAFADPTLEGADAPATRRFLRERLTALAMQR